MKEINPYLIKKVFKAVSFKFIKYTFEDEKNFDVYGSGELSGHRNKRFYIYNSKLFKSFYEEKMFNRDCSYISYVDKLAKNAYIPKNTYALKKSFPVGFYDNNFVEHYLIYNEVLGSQLLNYYSCNTTCNLAVQKSFEKSTLSIDMISEKDFLTLDELNCNLWNLELETNLSNIKKAILTSNYYISETNIKQIQNDYVYSFLIRNFVLKDRDFSNTNCALVSKNDEWKLVNFDFEYIFGGKDYESVVYQEILSYSKKHFPKTYNKFQIKTLDLYSGLQFLRTNNMITYENENHKDCVNFLMENLNKLMPYISEKQIKKDFEIKK